MEGEILLTSGSPYTSLVEASNIRAWREYMRERVVGQRERRNKMVGEMDVKREGKVDQTLSDILIVRKFNISGAE